jgi:hypothetical protein
MQIRITTAFVAGLAVGTGATYIITKSKLEKKYQALADEEIASVKQKYATDYIKADLKATEALFVSEVTDKDVFNPEEDVIDREVLNEDLYSKADVLTEEEVTEYNKIASNYQPDRETIRKSRNNNVPYLITADEFMDDGIHEDEKVVLTYYEEGGTIADEDDSIMDNVDEILGKENLNHFGDNPDDPDVIHIRNEAKGVDYEIVRNKLSYSEVVLGIKDWDADDIKDVQRRRPKKMRNDE